MTAQVHPVEEALEALICALESSDDATAAAAAARLDALCTEVSGRGERLPDESIQRAIALLLRCEKETGRVQESLRASILQSGNSRRATDVYRTG